LVVTEVDSPDPEVIVGEFGYAATATATGETFHVPCVSVLRVRDGEIVEPRDYVDHAAMAQVRERLAEPGTTDGAS
jgi:ketosteroid isomerase-like protein